MWVVCKICENSILGTNLILAIIVMNKNMIKILVIKTLQCLEEMHWKKTDYDPEMNIISCWKRY